MTISNDGTITSGYITIDNNAVLTTNSDWISLADCVSTSNVDKIRELELRVQVLENKLKQNKQDDKYKIIYGE